MNFSSWVAHDLRTPLRAIDGFSTELLANCGPHMDEKSKRDLCRICAAAQHMSQLIDDLLELSRLGGSPLNRQEVDLSLHARAIIEKLRRAEPTRSVDWVTAPGLRVTGDPGLLQIALDNLLRNAWKFTQKQDRARIEFGMVDQAGHRYFYVRDNGIGFDMAFKEKLFKPFERLHSNREYAGTGIGLALVHRIIRRHGGRIWAEGVEDRGATFYFTLF
jgi:signal transduction histidine kinase